MKKKKFYENKIMKEKKEKEKEREKLFFILY